MEQRPAFGQLPVRAVPPYNPPSQPMPVQLDEPDVTIQGLRKKMKESEDNLNAQKKMIAEQQAVQVKETVRTSENEIFNRMSVECGIHLEELSKLLASLKEHCSKDSVSHCKSWIFRHCANVKSMEVVMRFLLAIIKDARNSEKFKLHILYLMNDLAHHWTRKGVGDMLALMRKFVPLMFVFAYSSSTKDEGAIEKLVRLRNIWEEQKYFDQPSFSKMVSVDATIREHNEDQLKEFEANVAKVIDNFQSQYNKYNSQHMEYVRYVEAQIKSIENARQAAVSDPGPGSGIGPPPGPMTNFPGSGRLDSPPMMRGCPPGFGRPVNPIYPHPYSPRMPMMCDLMQMPRMYPGPNGRPYYPRAYNGPVPNCPPANGRPPWPRNGMGMPPFSGPPPAQGPSGPSWGYDRPRMPFRPAGVDPRAIPFMPRVTVRMNYFNSPAGLMLPLVRLEDHKYKVLDPECLRVPRPTVPQESLLAAVEAFYSKPNHEAPRDSEGWEKLGLYEYYRAKNIAIRQKRSLDSDTRDSANEDGARKHGRSSAGDTSSSSELDDASDVST